MTPVRVACWPRRGEHDYLRSLYLALESHGVVVSVDGAPFEDRLLRSARSQFDLLHLHWPEHLWGAGREPRLRRLRNLVGFRGYLETARSLGIPVVWTVHNLAPHEGASFVDGIGYRLLRRSAALAICHDQETYRVLGQRMPESRLLLSRIGNFRLVWPEPPSREDARRSLGLEPAERALVCFGLLRRYKGNDIAIRAAARLGRPYRLFIHGPAPDPAYLDELTRLAAGVPNVHVQARPLDDHELVTLLTAADCALLPYRAITGSAALLGALTAAAGFVATDLPFFSEALGLEPDAGILCTPNSDAALAGAIEKYFQKSPALRSAAARRLADQYDWDPIARTVAGRMRALVTR